MQLGLYLSIRSGSSTLCGRWDRKFDQLQIARQPLLILSDEAGKDDARKLNDLARQRREIERETR
jgi:hypothetical protein